MVVIKKILKNQDADLDEYYKKRESTIKLCKETVYRGDKNLLSTTKSINSNSTFNDNNKPQKVENKKELINFYNENNYIKILNGKRKGKPP